MAGRQTEDQTQIANFIAFEIPGEAVAFARAGKNGKRHYTPAKQARFMDAVRARAHQAMAGAPPMTGPVELAFRATYLIPPSWSKKKQAEAVWKTSKPDWDNLAKIAADAMNKIVYVDDAQIASSIVQKKYGPVCRVTILIMQLGGEL